MFNKARLKLTAWYLLIIMFISVAFSLVIYKDLSREVERFARVSQIRVLRRLHDNGFINPEAVLQAPLTPQEKDLVNESQQRIFFMLLVANFGILLTSGALGYLLAGKTLQPIKDMVDEQNRFISDASHELRTPLTSLKTAMEVSLRDKNLSLKAAKTIISESVTEVNKLQSLSDELLQLVQYQKPNGNLKFEKISLLRIINKAVQKMKPMAEKKHISLKNLVQSRTIEGNKYGLTDLIVIILDNAIKYSPKDTIVTIYSEKIDGSVLLSISDQGIGIDEKEKEHIFDRFYRVDTVRVKNNTGGYGLGLSIAKKIVDVHKGSITVVKNVKKGTTFTIRLPIKNNI